MIRLNNFVIQMIAINDIATLINSKISEGKSTLSELKSEVLSTLSDVWVANDIPENEQIRVSFKVTGYSDEDIVTRELSSKNSIAIHAENVSKLFSQLHPKDQQAAKILQHKLNMIYAK